MKRSEMFLAVLWSPDPCVQFSTRLSHHGFPSEAVLTPLPDHAYDTGLERNAFDDFKSLNRSPALSRGLTRQKRRQSADLASSAVSFYFANQRSSRRISCDQTPTIASTRKLIWHLSDAVVPSGVTVAPAFRSHFHSVILFTSIDDEATFNL
jgi:hypothetical protein